MNPVAIALPTPVRRTFDYLCPDPLPLPGTRVRVPFGQRTLVGWVMAAVATETPAERSLKPVQDVLDEAPLLSPALWSVVVWAAQYYQHPIGDAVSQAFPVLLRQGAPAESAHPPLWHLTERGRALTPQALARAPRQQALWQQLVDVPSGMSAETLRHLGFSAALLKSLADKGVLAAQAPEPVVWPQPVTATPGLTLGAEQAAAVAYLEARQGFSVTLLHGITGSGKTEVYLQAMVPVLAQGRQVLVLVPEIGLTPQTVARFRARFRVPVVALHSGLTDHERLQGWLAARAGEAGIVIGTRSAVWVPLARPGLLIIDEEHDLSFKQQEGFRYHARDVAIRRAQQENLPVILGSATPSLETLANAQAQRYARLPLSVRAGAAQPPRWQVVDVRGEVLKAGLSPAAQRAIADTLAAGQQVLVFLNRRGYAPVLLCHDCGWQAPCPRCDARPTLHHSPPRLHCHHCGYERRPPAHCPDCGSTDLRPLGVGTERLEEHLSAAFPDVPLWRVDRDTTRRKGSFDVLRQRMAQPGPALLVGTQMLAKGHDFPQVTQVVIPDVDSGLFSSDFRGAERLVQLLVQVGGRSGRGATAGSVLLQTHQPDHPLLTTLLTEGFLPAARALLAEREALTLPPFTAMALLRAEATGLAAPMAFCQQAAQAARHRGAAFPPGLSVWGPIPAPMTRRAGQVRVHVVLRHPRRAVLQALLNQWVPDLEGLPESRRVRWSLDVDPQEQH